MEATVSASPPSNSTRRPSSSSTTHSHQTQTRRRSIAIHRDLFANGEREAVRCRPSTVYLPADSVAGRGEEGRGGQREKEDKEEEKEVGWEEFFLSSAPPSLPPPPPRRSSLPQHHHHQHPPLPPLTQDPNSNLLPAAYTFSPSFTPSSSFAARPRRHSEQPTHHAVPHYSPLHHPSQRRPSLAASGLPSPPAVETLLPPPPPTYRQNRSQSLTTTTASSHYLSLRPAAAGGGGKVKRKPVPALDPLALENEVEVVVEEDKKEKKQERNGRTPPLVPLKQALASPSSVGAGAGAGAGKVDFEGYGFPPLSGAGGKATVLEQKREEEQEKEPMAVDKDEVDPLGSGLEEKVRRMSLETTQSGATGLGLGLRPPSPPPSPTISRRRTLAEVKAEKMRERERGRRRSEGVGAVLGKGRASEEAEEKEGCVRERRRTEGSLGIETNLPLHAASLAPPISPAHSSYHGSSTSGASRPTSSLSSTSLPLTAQSSTSSSSSSSKRPTFRPFALIKQKRSRPLPAHEVIISPIASASGQGKRDEDLVDAWMDIILGGDKDEEEGGQEGEGEAGVEDDLDTPLAAPPAIVFGPSSPSSTTPPPAPRLPSMPSPAEVPVAATGAWGGLGVYGAETVASLASSLPPLVYGAAVDEQETSEEVQEEDSRMQEDSDAHDEFVDASEGRPSLDNSLSSSITNDDVAMSASSPSMLRPTLTPSASSAFLDLPPAPRRLNKRSASASFLDKTTSPPAAFSSAPASPTFTAAFSAVFRPSAPRNPSAVAAPPTSPPLAQPAAKRQHLSSSLSPPFPSAPSFSLVSPAHPKSATQTAPPATAAPSSGRDKPLPARPPRPPKSTARRLVLTAEERKEGGAGVGRKRSAERMRDGRAERELESCPVLLDRFVSTSSDSGASSVEAIKLDSTLQDHRPLVAVVL